MFGDRLRELDSLLRVLDRFFECALGDPHGHRADSDPPAVEDFQRVREPLVLLSEQCGGRDVAVREDHLRRRAAAHPELVLDPADREAGISALHDERTDPAIAFRRVRDGVDYERPGDGRVCAEVLRAVEDPAVLPAFRGRLHCGGIRTALWFRERPRAELAAAREVRDILAPLVLVSRQPDRPGAEGVVGRHDERVGSAYAGHLLHGDRQGQRVEACAVVLFRDRHSEESEAGHLRDRRLRELARLIDVRGHGADFFFREVPRGPADHLVFRRELKVHCDPRGERRGRPLRASLRLGRSVVGGGLRGRRSPRGSPSRGPSRRRAPGSRNR